MDKEKLRDFLIEYLERKLLTLLQEEEKLRTSQHSETKSSAGDKYETSREMIQGEIDRLNSTILAQKNNINILKSLNLEAKGSIQLGSLVSTTVGNYFVSVGLGKVDFEKHPVFVVSLESPIGAALKGQKAGDSLEFNGKKLNVLEVV